MENTSTLAALHHRRAGGEGEVTIPVCPYSLSASSGSYTKNVEHNMFYFKEAKIIAS